MKYEFHFAAEWEIYRDFNFLRHALFCDLLPQTLPFSMGAYVSDFADMLGAMKKGQNLYICPAKSIFLAAPTLDELEDMCNVYNDESELHLDFAFKVHRTAKWWYVEKLPFGACPEF